MGDGKANNEFKVTEVVRPREQVEEQIRHAILSGHFAQGDKLPPETELAQMFAVSRPTIREALQSLAAEGLIYKVPGATGGSFVKSVNHEALGNMLHESMANILQLGTLDIEEVARVRRLLDIPAAQLAAEHRTERDLEVMRSVVSHQRATTLADPDIAGLDVTFHSAIGEATENRLLAAFVSSLHRVTRPARFLKLSAEVGRRTVRQHMAILAAIESKDPRSAGELMAKHLDYVLRFSAQLPKL